ncbi:MAG: ribosome biogenesis GTPase YlqF, partial [Clostridia bacterium]|nr:ribosome biogenesis GTPase YlqF [Clostridia bacterium]
LDTPGTLFPDFKDQQKAQRLAFIGSIRDEVVDQEELARELALCMMQLYPKEFMQKYSLTQTDDAEEIMRQICKKRGFLLRGGDFDMERCSKGLVDDFRKGKICPVTLEMPDEGTN